MSYPTPKPYPDHLGATLARYRRHLVPGTPERLAIEWASGLRHLPRPLVEREVVNRLRSPAFRRYVLAPLPDPTRRAV